MKLKLNQRLPQVVKRFQIHSNPHCSALGIFCFILFLLFLNLNLQAQAEIKVSDSKQNFGYVKRGELITCRFELTNTGNQPLVLKSAEVSCSCTQVDYSKQPILPGQKSTIVVSFDTKTVYGRQDRVVLIESNAKNNPVKLRYKGIVSNH